MRAPRRKPRSRDVTGFPAPRGRLLATLAAGLAIASCSGRAPAATSLAWTLTPTPPAVGPATLTVTLRDAAGAAVTGATVRIQAHMSHPGMTPVVADASERTPGVYVVPFAFTMPGDWVLLVSATLSGGGRVEQRIDVANVQAPGQKLSRNLGG